MSNKTSWFIVIVLGGFWVLQAVSQEYALIRSAIGETKAKTDAVADETKATMEAIKQTIEDLRAKFRLLETQMEAKATEQKPVDDVAEEQQTKQTKPTIVMHSASWCGPCQKWKREALPQWKAIGWTVDVVEDDATTQTVPWFEITDSDGTKFKSTGYLTRETFERDKTLQRNLKANK